MKAAFALLADYETHNAVRKLTWRMFQRHGISLDICRLPPHVSLKQPFDIPDVALLESYVTELAGSLSPVTIRLTELQLIEAAGIKETSGILWLKAEQSPELCQLHERLNKELASRFSNTQADFDGSDYQFHLTLSIGKPFSVYHKAYQEFREAFAEIRFQAHSLALFAYDGKSGLETEYISYKFLPLGKEQETMC